MSANRWPQRMLDWRDKSWEEHQKTGPLSSYRPDILAKFADVVGELERSCQRENLGGERTRSMKFASNV